MTREGERDKEIKNMEDWTKEIKSYIVSQFGLFKFSSNWGKRKEEREKSKKEA